MGLFSATLPQLVEELVLPSLDRPVRVTVGERLSPAGLYATAEMPGAGQQLPCR